ncbi:MAG: hypothetical protein AB7Q42_01505 [Acidimicrobiia bacterium]
MSNSDDRRRDAQGIGDASRSDAGTSAASGRSGLSPAAIGLFVLIAVSVVFILQNRDRTTIDFLVFELRSRVWTAIAVSIALGALLDRLLGMWWRKRRRDRVG